MSEICWFCKKNPADATKTIVFPIHRVLDAQSEKIDQFVLPGYTKTTYQYKTGKIDILRCKECAEIHAKNGKKYRNADNVQIIVQVVGTLVLAGIGYLLRDIKPIICVAGVVWLGLILSAILIKDHYDKSLGQMETAKYELPEVTSILNSGWKVGDWPSKY